MATYRSRFTGKVVRLDPDYAAVFGDAYEEVTDEPLFVEPACCGGDDDDQEDDQE